MINFCALLVWAQSIALTGDWINIHRKHVNIFKSRHKMIKRCSRDLFIVSNTKETTNKTNRGFSFNLAISHRMHYTNSLMKEFSGFVKDHTWPTHPENAASSYWFALLMVTTSSALSFPVWHSNYTYTAWERIPVIAVKLEWCVWFSNVQTSNRKYRP